MKQKLLQILIIIIVMYLAFLLEGLGMPKDTLEFAELLNTFIYLVIFSTLQFALGIWVWLFLSEKFSVLFEVNSRLKYGIYLLLNTIIPPVALIIQAYFEWGFRLTQNVLINNYFDKYCSEYGFVIFGMLPTLIKVLIDAVNSKRNIFETDHQ